MIVPETAIVQRGEKTVLFVVAENKAKEVPVRIGKRIEGRVEVREGLSGSDVVVIAGNAQLRDGAEVEIVSAAAAASE